MYGRAFLGTMAGGLLAAPRAAEAQPSGKVPRVGYLSVFSPSNPYPPSEAFWQGLHDLGWIEGQNIAIERRVAGGVRRHAGGSRAGTPGTLPDGPLWARGGQRAAPGKPAGLAGGQPFPG